MAHSASEVFTMQLARAAAKQANKFLVARGLNNSDRDDVIAAAMLWCWENRDNYSLITTLETWFMNAIRDAYKDLRRGSLPTASESIENIGGGDDTFNRAAAVSSARALMEALTPAERRAVTLIAQGYTREEMIEMNISKRSFDECRQHIKQLRRLMPDNVGRWTDIYGSRTAATPTSDDADDKLSEIDVELEQLDFAPPAGKDCPPCWRCMWFEGFMPAAKRSVRMEIEDLEVREAVKFTEARKIKIAQQVRDGL